MQVQINKLKTTYFIAFLITYIAALCWIYFDVYIAGGFYKKLGIIYMINHSITAFCYLLANLTVWVLMKIRIRKWNADVSPESDEILDR